MRDKKYIIAKAALIIADFAAAVFLVVLVIALAFRGWTEDSAATAPSPTPELLVVFRDIPVEVTVAPSPEPEGPSEAAVVLAKTVFGEAGGCSRTQQAAVVWCVLNRVDSPDYPDDIVAAATAEGQFHGYRPDNPVDPEILAICEDVLARWELEKLGVGSAGRVLPPEYLFFEGDGKVNHFRTAYKSGVEWDWSLPSPYEG